MKQISLLFLLITMVYGYTEAHPDIMSTGSDWEKVSEPSDKGIANEASFVNDNIAKSGSDITATYNAVADQQVTGFVLVSAATEQDIQPINDGAIISLASLPTTKLNIRANTSPSSVGSVKLELSGTQSKTYTDNAAPYALHGDDGSGNYYYGNWNPPATGTYTLRATPYSGAKATGTAGTPLTITFTFTETGGTPPPTEQFTLAITTVGSGTVTKDPNQSSYDSGSSVKLTATPASGYQFAGWSGDASGSTNPLSVTMNSNKTITASFTELPKTGTEGFASITKLGVAATHSNLGDQPQSKVWQYDGRWWAVFPTTNIGTHIWRLDGTSWTRVQRLSTSAQTKADCKVVGNIVHIFLYRGSSLPSEFVSVEYDSGAKTYKPWAQRTSNVSIQLDAGVKTATVDIDGKGRMWLASNGNNNVYVRWSDAPYTSWSSPLTLATGLNADDICAVVAIPALNRIGVLWSNQNTKRFGFRTHADGAAPSSWTSDEIPASQSAIGSGDGMADDHLNMAVASNGTLYCAVKTGYRDPYPKIALLVRRPSGSWDNLHGVSTAGNRPIVVLNETVGKVKVIYAAPNAGGIFYKESSTSSISFGSERSLISESCDYATSSKANYSSDIVIFASTSKEAYSVLASDIQPLSGASIASVEVASQSLVAEEGLTAAPNPFQNTTTLRFTLPEDGEYEVVLHDLNGNRLGTLKQGSAKAGEQVTCDLDGSKLTDGLYLVRLQTSGKTSILKLMLNR